MLAQVERAEMQTVFFVVDDAQTLRNDGGRMRKDTGELQGSLVIEMDGNQVGAGVTAHQGVFANHLGWKVTIKWTAPHAIPREFGANGQEPDYFVRGAMQKAPGIFQQALKAVGL